MPRESAVILERDGSCTLPPEIDLKKEELIFGVSLPATLILLEDVAEDLGIILLSVYM